MILEGANKLNENPDYIIYTMNSTTAGQYCVVVPNNANGTINMLIDLHEKKLIDEVASGAKTKEDLITELSTEYNKVKEKYSNGLLIVPMIEETEYISAVTNVDKQKMFDETKKIGAITSELYKKLTESGIEKSKIDQKIIMIQKQSEDEKYVNWLKEQMPNYVEGISLEEKTEEVNTNPFTSGDIFGIASTEEKNEETQPAEVETPTTETPNPVTENQVPETPTVETPTPSAGGIFDSTPSPVAPIVPETPIPVPEITPEPSIVETPIAPQPSTDIFGSSSEQPETPTTTPTQQPVQEPMPTEANQFFEAPKPVQNVELEGTTTFSPIPNIPQQPVEKPQPETQPTTETGTEQVEPKKNGGFVNLAILLVILIAVTIVSIELGKFLYSVYGA